MNGFLGKIICLVLASGLWLSTASADVLVLVHGFMGSSQSWEQSGVQGVLRANGWGGRANTSNNPVYSVDLPSTAPLGLQAEQLQWALNGIAVTHPDEPLIIAAHSAGGIIARLLITRGTVVNVKALITIATPHLGTPRAYQALDVADNSGVTGWIKDIFGGRDYKAIKHARGAIRDFVPAHPGSLTFALNQRVHPSIKYYSIIHLGSAGLGDELVPAYSQDMNNVNMLKGRSAVLPLVTMHSLGYLDGLALVSILQIISPA